MEEAASIRDMALPWMHTLPMALPEQLGEGLDRDLVNQGLQRLIGCDGVGAVVMFGSRALGNARPDSDLDLAVICTEPELSLTNSENVGRPTARLWGLWAARLILSCKARTMRRSWRARAGM